MRTKYSVIVLMVALLLMLGSGARVYAEAVIQTTTFIVVSDGSKVLGTWPTEGVMRFSYTLLRQLNTTDPSGPWKTAVAERVFPRPSEQRVYVPELGAVIEVGVYNSSYHQIFVSGSTAYVYLSLEYVLKFRFVTPPTVYGEVAIGAAISRAVFSVDDPKVTYIVLINNTGTGESFIAGFSGPVGFSGLQARVVPLVANVTVGSPTEYVVTGNISSGVVMVPLRDVKVCLSVPSETALLGVTVSVENVSKLVYVTGREPSCAVLEGVRIPTTGNASVAVRLTTGDGSVVMNTTENLEGQIITVAQPRLYAFAGNETDETVFFVAVPATSASNPPTLKSELFVSVKGAVLGDFGCPAAEISNNETVVVSCWKTVNAPLQQVINDTLRVKYIVKDPDGVLHEVSGVTAVVAYDMTSLAGMATMMYDMVRTALLGAYILLALLFMVNQLTSSTFMARFLDEEAVRRGLFTIVGFLLVFYVAIPASYAAFGYVVKNVPMLSAYINGSVPADPREAFRWMVGYYDKLFVRIEQDYSTIFVGSVNSILGKVGIWAALAAGLFIAGLFLATPLTPGGSIPFGAVGATLLSMAFSFLSVLIASAPLSAAILVAAIITRVVLVFITVIMLVLVGVAAVMLIIPSPAVNVLGERILGAALTYFIIFPLIAPIAYALYMHTLSSALSAVGGSISASLPGVSLVLPVGEVSSIMVYVISAGMVEALVVVSTAYVLTRTGLMSSLGEAFVAIVSRG